MFRRTFCKAVVAAAVAVVGLTALSGDLFAQGRGVGLEQAIAAQEKHTEVLMARPGVVGTAVGLDDDGGHVVLVLLEKGGVGGIPRELEGVPVQVEVTGKIYALADRTARVRPAPIGFSTGHPDITAGTIGCRVYDDLDDDGVRDAGEPVYALSNNHVYADENQANPGDPVIQPGKYDGGIDPRVWPYDTSDVIGTLTAFERIWFDGTDNTIDAAIAESSVDLLGNATPSDEGYGVPKSEPIDPAVRMEIQKYGRTTGWTTAKIAGINASVNVGYDSGVARFVRQIYIRAGGFSAGGDSGSLIVANYPGDPRDRQPVGLLFAGSSSSTIANPIDAVLIAFGVTIDGTPDAPAAPVADFVGSPTSGVAPLTVDFLDLSTGLPTSWLWDFGDGGTSTLQDPSYTFDMPGTYTVKLTATNAVGSDQETKTNYITVTEPGAGVTVTGIDDNTTPAGTSIDVTITGSGFAAGASVTFENGSGPAPTASNVVVVDGNTITATVTAKSGGPPRNRVWDVRVTNPDSSSGVLLGGFTVTP